MGVGDTRGVGGASVDSMGFDNREAQVGSQTDSKSNIRKESED